MRIATPGLLLKPGRRHSLQPGSRSLPPAAAPIALLPLGEVGEDELRFVDELMGAAFGADTLVLDAMETPRHAYSVPRAQYDADVLLDELFARFPERSLRVVGVTQADLYVAGRTFVFGYAHLSDGVAVYSSARFREEFYGRKRDLGRQRLRVSRALIHELGHTFGNPHCIDPNCVMHPVTHVETLDALAPWYCANCHARVRGGLDVAPWSARGRWERGMTYLRRREFARATELLEHAVRCAPNEPRYHNDLGVARLSAGDREGARAAFRRAAELGFVRAEGAAASAAQAAGACDTRRRGQ
jgi:archaemetzincin